MVDLVTSTSDVSGTSVYIFAVSLSFGVASPPLTYANIPAPRKSFREWLGLSYLRVTTPGSSQEKFPLTQKWDKKESYGDMQMRIEMVINYFGEVRFYRHN